MFETATDPLFIGVTSDQQWTRFVAMFELGALAADPRLATNALRAKERPWLIPTLQETLRTLPADVIAARCEEAVVSWAPVAKPTDLFDDPHLLSHGGLLETAISNAAGLVEMAGMPALPLEFGPDRVRPGLTRQPPGLGEHNGEVLAAAGFSAAEIAALTDSKAIVAAA